MSRRCACDLVLSGLPLHLRFNGRFPGKPSLPLGFYSTFSKENFKGWAPFSKFCVAQVFTGLTPFLLPSQQYQSTEGNSEQSTNSQSWTVLGRPGKVAELVLFSDCDACTPDILTLPIRCHVTFAVRKLLLVDGFVMST